MKIAATASGSCGLGLEAAEYNNIGAQNDLNTDILWCPNFRNCDIHCMNCSRGNYLTRLITG